MSTTTPRAENEDDDTNSDKTHKQSSTISLEHEVLEAWRRAVNALKGSSVYSTATSTSFSSSDCHGSRCDNKNNYPPLCKMRADALTLASRVVRDRMVQTWWREQVDSHQQQRGGGMEWLKIHKLQLVSREGITKTMRLSVGALCGGVMFQTYTLTAVRTSEGSLAFEIFPPRLY